VGLRLLLVDDNEDGLFMLGAVLTRFGAFVTLASSAAMALELGSQTGADLLVLDISMPEMDGLTLLPLLRAQLGPVPALAFTALTGPEVRRDTDAAGFDALAHKPLDIEPMVLTLAELGRLRPLPGSP